MLLVLIFFIRFSKCSTNFSQLNSKSISENKISNDFSNDRVVSFYFYISHTIVSLFKTGKTTIKNSDIDNYYFKCNEGVWFYFEDKANKLDHLFIQKLLKRINFGLNTDVTFIIDENKHDDLVEYMVNKTNSIYIDGINKSNNINIYIRLSKYCVYHNICTEHNYSGWRHVCIDGYSYCRYGTEEKIQVEYMKMSVFVIITIVAIIVVFAFIVSFYLIGYFKYKKILKKRGSKSLSADEM